MSCVFCPPNWDNLDRVPLPSDRWSPEWFAVVNPLDPVTPGHVLVISAVHTKDAADSDTDPEVAPSLMDLAADYVRVKGIQANIITSIGPLATQTVFHTHVHVVPRRENDGLPLPWTPQQARPKPPNYGVIAP